MSKLAKPVPVERRIFSTNLKASRKYTGFTLQQVADKTGFTLSYISNVENGNQNTTVTAMALLSQALCFPLYALLNPAFKPESFDPTEWEGYLTLVQEAKPDCLELKLLAENTRLFRKKAGLTQSQVDHFADLADKTVAHIERQSINTSLEFVAPLAVVIGAPLHKIFNPNPL